MRLSRTEEIRSVHQSEYYRNLVSVLGDPGPLVTPLISPPEPETSWAKNFLRKHGYGGGPIFGINPGAAYGDAKMWYAERFAKVSDELVKKFGGKVIIFGGTKDLEAAKEVSRSMKTEAIFAAGMTTIRELIALISTCTVFITNDSGPMHIAAALGVPIVAIFGSTNPITTSPMGRAEIIRHEVECSPCLLRTCPRDDHLCMELVETSEVIDGVEKFILSK
jgi:heptosyltransferase-2